ncbi:hypothetical protein SEVIR_7G028201v4 [Setaria viridis]|uniref:uncharacterized protein n=1 Tax=Setaria viridis TaxID=4556 RepID=UPI001493B738|nr:triadin-like [Setaria viridis]
MATKRHARGASSDDSEDLGHEGAKKPAKPAPPSPEDEGSEEERDTEAMEEESDKSGDARPVRHALAAAAPKPKETLNRAKKPSPAAAAEDVGAQASGEAPLVRDALPDELAAAAPPLRKKSKTKKTTKPVKRPPPPSEEESGDPSLVSNETAAVSLRREIVASLDHNKRGAMSPPLKRAKRDATPPQEDEEQVGKRAAGADNDGTSEPQAGTGVLVEKTFAALSPQHNKRSKTSAPKYKHKNKKKKQPGKGLAKLPQPKSAGFELTSDRDEALGAGNTLPPQEKDGAQEDKQHGEGKEDEGLEVSSEALSERDASSPKPCSSEEEKKPAVERSWSKDDELKILHALVEHAQSHHGAQPDSSHLLANLTFDKIDANADKLNDKIRKLRTRYRRWCLQGCPTDNLGGRLFELSAILWGQGDDDVQVEATSTKEFSQRSSLYPYLAEEVKAYAETHTSGDLVMAAFATIGHDKARHLDAMCKQQRVDSFKLERSQANLTKAMLSAFSSYI